MVRRLPLAMEFTCSNNFKPLTMLTKSFILNDFDFLNTWRGFFEMSIECCKRNSVFRGNQYTSGQHFKHELVDILIGIFTGNRRVSQYWWPTFLKLCRRRFKSQFLDIYSSHINLFWLFKLVSRLLVIILSIYWLAISLEQSVFEA